MPTYRYRCEKCGKRFERTETFSEHEAVKPKCPKCGSKKVSFVPANAYVVTSKKSQQVARRWNRKSDSNCRFGSLAAISERISERPLYLT
jgi:putative FmdB family regulatory protein